MQPRTRLSGPLTAFIGVAAILTVVGCSRMSDGMSDTKAKVAEAGRAAATPLSGAQEVPPVNTQATGTSSIVVTGDKYIIGSVEVNGVNATAAHVHEGAPGQNGPVIIPLVKTGANIWSIPANTILTSQQFDAYQRGNLYVNVHSAANPNGEVRAQLKP
jgi:CHRD domain-containing protein